MDDWHLRRGRAFTPWESERSKRERATHFKRHAAELYSTARKLGRVTDADDSDIRYIREAPDPYSRWASAGDEPSHDSIAAERYSSELHDAKWARINAAAERNRLASVEFHRRAYEEYQRDHAGKVPRVVGAAAIEAACDDGEPIEIKGTASLPKQEAPPVQDLLYIDLSWNNQFFNGEYDQSFNDVCTPITSGFGNGQRQGTKVKVKAFEFRFRVVNTKEKFEMQNTYGWAGNAGVVGTTKDIPAIQFPVDSWRSNHFDSGGGVAMQFINAPAIALQPPPPAPPILSTFYPQNLYAGLVGPAASTNLGASIGPTTAVTLQPSQIGVVDQPAFPPFPTWQSPAIFSANGPEAGNMCPVRVMVLQDKYGQDAQYVIPGTEPSWFDIMSAPPFDGSPVHGLYNPRSLERFLVLYDAVWEPQTTNYEMTVVCPPKKVCLETIYEASPVGVIASGGIYFAICASEQTRIIPPSPKYYSYSGTFRLFYEDH